MMTGRITRVIKTANIKESQRTEDATQAFIKTLLDEDPDSLKRIIFIAQQAHTTTRWIAQVGALIGESL